MKKLAIVYYSLSGNTDFVAKEISKNLEVDLIRLIPKKEYPNSGFKKFFWGGKSAVMKETPELEEYKFDSDKYDNIIIGTPVWASTFTPPIRTFIKDNKDKLKDKNISIFISCGGTGNEKTIEKIKNYLGIENIRYELILIDPKDKYSELIKDRIKEFCNKIKEG